MDDYIFLIIAVVISIFAAIKKNKKKEEGIPLKKEFEKPKHFLFDQLLPEEMKATVNDDFDFPDMEEPIIFQEPVKIPEPAMMYEIPRETFESHLPKQKRNNMQLTVKKAVEVDEDKYETEEEEMTGYLEDFSLRKAVVYYEIMKPKFEGGRTTLF